MWVSLAGMALMGATVAWTRFDSARARKVVPLTFAIMGALAAFHGVLGIVALGLGHLWRACYELGLCLAVVAGLRFLRWFQGRIEAVR